MKKQITFFLLLLQTALFFKANAAPANGLNTLMDGLKKSAAYCEKTDGVRLDQKQIRVERSWVGNSCQSFIVNNSNTSVRVDNIVLFEANADVVDPGSNIYGEGFQMLTQITGTLAHPQALGYTDVDHYKIKGPRGMMTAYGLFTLTTPDHQSLLLGFSSCRKFIGRISFTAQKILVTVDAENLLLKPGEKVALEDFLMAAGSDKNKLLDQLAQKIEKTHPPIFKKDVPVGWCSWYCYGPRVTQEDVQENMKGFQLKAPAVKYIQIDDGYQPFMGDWLEPNPQYGSLEKSLKGIKEAGFIPAIWLAPFIAEKDSKLFREHPDWFVKDSTGQPLVSSSVGFGGWRNGPWYVLDGTHPQAQHYLKQVITTMRKEWGVEYFKLDANYWGAIHKGIHYDKSATRVEAYRAGMKALLEACGENTIVLGCNHPIWPSFGLITASRTSNDVSRNWEAFTNTGKENLMRAWQNGKFWLNDPDCFVFTANGNSGKELTENEFLFHATVVHAIGGLVLLGDKYKNLAPGQFDVINKQLHPTGKPARFTNDRFETGITDLGKVQYYYFLNWDDHQPATYTIKLKNKSRLTDFWKGGELGIHEGNYVVRDLPPHSGLIIKAETIR